MQLLEFCSLKSSAAQINLDVSQIGSKMSVQIVRVIFRIKVHRKVSLTWFCLLSFIHVTHWEDSIKLKSATWHLHLKIQSRIIKATVNDH